MKRHPLARKVAEAVAAEPAERALEFDERWYMWAEIAAAMKRIGKVIDDVHIGQGPPVVGVLMRNKPIHVTMLLALLERGGCLVVINPARGRDTVRSDVRELNLSLVLGDSSDLDLLSGLQGGTALCGFADLDADAHVVYRPRTPASGPRYSGVGVRMLTSGTTGPPKRVDLTYDALDASIAGARHYESGKKDPARRSRGVAIVNSPLAHLGGVFRVLQAVLDRRAFVFLERFEVQAWLRAVRKYRPKTASLVPTALRMVLEAGPDPADLASLRAVTSGTAPLSPDDADAFTARFGVPVLTSYAATEFAGGVAGWALRDYEKYWERKRGSVGRVQPGCSIRVVDERTGEVLAADRPGLLEVKPAQLGPSGDWVLTNDLARIDADGFLYILGRADGAINRGGFKVLPDRVRAVLERHPDVRGAVVIGVPDDRLGAVPVALIELRAGARTDAGALAQAVSGSLAGYERPAEIHIVDELPRTLSGKVDLRASEYLLRTVRA